mmetsp:Transcript_56333/g.167561  ORF Transcript_56333/g.167561 Transcript_56333/m.167561 type:complete len:262 (-) Transcript_56333:29-814(-)
MRGGRNSGPRTRSTGAAGTVGRGARPSQRPSPTIARRGPRTGDGAGRTRRRSGAAVMSRSTALIKAMIATKTSFSGSASGPRPRRIGVARTRRSTAMRILTIARTTHSRGHRTRRTGVASTSGRAAGGPGPWPSSRRRRWRPSARSCRVDSCLGSSSRSSSLASWRASSPPSCDRFTGGTGGWSRGCRRRACVRAREPSRPWGATSPPHLLLRSGEGYGWVWRVGACQTFVHVQSRPAMLEAWTGPPAWQDAAQFGQDQHG